MKSGSSVSYTNGNTRIGLASVITLNALRGAARTLEANRAKKVTSAIASGPNFDTSAVEQSYIVFMHTDMVADVRNLAGFVPKEKYGGAFKPVHPREIGAVEDFRFVTSPLFAPILAGGAGVGGGFVSVGAANNDVYPLLIIGESCVGHISLKGKGGKTGISPTIIPSSQKNHANPSGMFGYVGADFWFETVRLNENWMSRIECNATAL
jgi:N4-gp56 family major capsid protein